MTVDVVLPQDLAVKAFGMYVYATNTAADLSEFPEGSLFYEEVARQMRELSAADQLALRDAIAAAIEQ